MAVNASMATVTAIIHTNEGVASQFIDRAMGDKNNSTNATKSIDVVPNEVSEVVYTCDKS